MKQIATREIKLETIRLSVAECNLNHLPALKERLIAMCDKWWGARRQTAQELLKSLVNNEEIIIENEEVWTYEQWEKIKESREKDYLKMCDLINKGQRNL